MTRTLAILDQAPAACCIPLGATAMSEEDAGTTAEVFKALADPGRVKIVNLLANAPGPVCVCDLTPELGLSQPTVSFHLKKLVQAGLIELDPELRPALKAEGFLARDAREKERRKYGLKKARKAPQYSKR